VAYHGKVEHANVYFGNLGYKCPQFANPSEFFMDTLEANDKQANAADAFFGPAKGKAEGLRTPPPAKTLPSQKALLEVIEENDLEAGSAFPAPRKVQRLTDAWAEQCRRHAQVKCSPPNTTAQVAMAAKMFGKRSTLDAVVEALDLNTDNADAYEYPTSFTSQFWTLWRRTWLVSLRDKAQFQGRIFSAVFIAVLIGLIYFQQPLEQHRAQDREAVLFLCMMVHIMLSLQQTIIAMPLEREFMTREYGNGTYRLLPWYLARTMTSCILQIFFSTIFAVIVYYMVGFNPSFHNVIVYLAVSWLSGCIGTMMGFDFGSLVSKVTTAQTLIGPILLPLQLFSGFMVQPQSIPIYFKWLYYLSFYGYSFQTLVVNEFQHLVFEPCSMDQFKSGQCPFGPTIDGEVQTGLIVLDAQNYKVNSVNRNLGILCGFFGVLYIAGYFIVKTKLRSRSS